MGIIIMTIVYYDVTSPYLQIVKISPWMTAGHDKQQVLMLLNGADNPVNCPLPWGICTPI